MGKNRKRRGIKHAPAQVAPPPNNTRALMLIIAGVLFLCVTAITIAWAVTRAPPTVEETQSQGSGNVVMLGLKGGRYTPEPITIKAGEPVTLRNDGTVRGCGAFVIQRDLGINANFLQSPEYTFTPTKKGTYQFSCSMGMYVGTIEVV